MMLAITEQGMWGVAFGDHLVCCCSRPLKVAQAGYPGTSLLLCTSQDPQAHLPGLTTWIACFPASQVQLHLSGITPLNAYKPGTMTAAASAGRAWTLPLASTGAWRSLVT